jgi:effector-binding domain-containing protein
MITEPKIEHRNAQPYMGIRAQVTMQELGKVLPPLWGEVYGWLASKGLKPIGAPLWRYRVIDMAAKLEIDVAVPVAGATTGDNRIIADILPAGLYATLIYTGPYEGLMQATADLFGLGREERHCLGQAACRSQKRGLAGTCRELPHRPNKGAGSSEMGNRASV